MPSLEVWSFISRSLGYTSIGIWLCAQLPQVYENQKNRHCEGISLGFLAAWLVGDISAVIGCVLTGQLGFQTFLATYYVIMDIVLTVQYYYFAENRPPSDVLVGVEPLDNSNRPAKRSFSRRLSSFISMTTIAGSFGRSAGLPLGPVPTTVGSAVTGLGSGSLEAMATNSWSMGYVFAYLSTVMYVASRIPQMLHNYERKSTEGMAPLLFVATFLGNLTYTLSILFSREAMGPNGKEFLYNELSFILGAAGTMFFDVLLLLQRWIYRPRYTILAAVPASSVDSAAQLRAMVNRKPNDKTMLLLSHQSIYSDIGITHLD